MRKIIITFILILLISTISVSGFRLTDYITGNAVVDESGCQLEKVYIGLNDKSVKTLFDRYSFQLVSVSKDRKKAKVKVNGVEEEVETNVANIIEGVTVNYYQFGNKRLSFNVWLCEEQQKQCLTENVRFKFGQAKQFTFLNQIFDVKVNYIGKNHGVSVIVNNGQVKRINGKEKNLNEEGLIITNKGTKYGDNTKTRWVDLEIKYCSDDPALKDKNVCRTDSEVIGYRDRSTRYILGENKVNLLKVSTLGRQVTLIVNGNEVKLNKAEPKKVGSLEVEYVSFIASKGRLDRFAADRNINLKFKDCTPETVEEEPEQICFENGICEVEYGETLDNCPADCTPEVVQEEPAEPEPTTVPNPEDEDLNADGTITEADVELWQSLFRGCIFGDNEDCAKADINADTSIDGRDRKQIRDAIE